MFTNLDRQELQICCQNMCASEMYLFAQVRASSSEFERVRAGSSEFEQVRACVGDGFCNFVTATVWPESP